MGPRDGRQGHESRPSWHPRSPGCLPALPASVPLPQQPPRSLALAVRVVRQHLRAAAVSLQVTLHVWQPQVAASSHQHL